MHWTLLYAETSWPFTNVSSPTAVLPLVVSVRSCRGTGGSGSWCVRSRDSAHTCHSSPHTVPSATPCWLPVDIFFVKENLVYKTKYQKFPVCCNLNMKGPCWSRILLRWILFPPWILPIHWSSARLLIALFCNVFPCSAMFYFCFSF